MSTTPREIAERALEANGRFDPVAAIVKGLKILGERVYAWVVLLMTFALFAWTILHPDWLRLATACAFTALVLVPLAWRERTR